MVPGTKVDFTITFDETILQNTPLKDCVLLHNCMDSFMRYLINSDNGIYKIFEKYNKKDSEYYYPDQFLQGTPPNLCLGGGSGFFSKTVLFSLAPSFSEAVNYTKTFMDGMFYRHKHKSTDREISPRTLKLAQYGKYLHLMGWCCMEEIK